MYYLSGRIVANHQKDTPLMMKSEDQSILLPTTCRPRDYLKFERYIT
jgi:hypothetical protein